MGTTQVSKSSKIPEHRLAEFKATIEKLQRRAVKLNCGAIGYKVLGEEIRTIRDTNPDGSEYKYALKFIEVSVFGDAPQLAGWRFIAKIDHDKTIGNIVSVLPSQELPTVYRDADLYNCDHCHKKLFRRDTFVVQHVESGAFKQVGRQCLRDFLGHENPESVARYFEVLEMVLSFGSDWDEAVPGSGGVRYESLLDTLCAASAAIRLFGWASRKQEQEDDTNWVLSTASRVSFNRDCKSSQKLEIIESDKTNAESAIAWFQEHDDKEDFFYNAKLLADAGWAKLSHVGLVAAMMWIFIRNEQRSKVEHINYEYLGTPGQRIEIGEVKLLSIYGPMDSQFGPQYIYRFSTGKHLLVWFTGRLLGKQAGESLHILKATVREHKEYHNQKETIISRATLAQDKNLSKECANVASV